MKVLSRVISFSSDNKFSENLDQMIEDSVAVIGVDF